MPDWLLYPALFASGLVAGVLNVVAGGGSFLTLPVLLLLGMPAAVANGTNRVGIVLQNVGAVWGFERHGVMPRRWAALAVLPGLPGALLGTWAALVIGDDAFRKILAGLMIAITLWSLLAPARARGAEGGPGEGAPPPTGWTAWVTGAGFFVIGLYAGFVQAGVGFLVLAVLGFAGLDLVRGNAIKVLAILVFTILSLVIFAWQGKVEWVAGLVLAAGMVVGGLLGVRWTVAKGERWVRVVVTVAVIAFAIALWLES